MLTKLGKRQRSGELVDLLLECHGRIRSFLALARAAGEREDVPESELADACARVERYFREALPLHVRDEEDSLLPRLAGTLPEVDAALEAMRAEHAQHEAKLQAMFAALTALREGLGDARRRAALATAALELELDLEAHLHAEETVIFPAVRRLEAAVQARIVEELRARRKP